MTGAPLYNHDKSTRASACTSFTVIRFTDNSKTITDRGNLLEYNLKPMLYSKKRLLQN
jgi:hypothetical protein